MSSPSSESKMVGSSSFIPLPSPVFPSCTKKKEKKTPWAVDQSGGCSAPVSSGWMLEGSTALCCAGPRMQTLGFLRGQPLFSLRRVLWAPAFLFPWKSWSSGKNLDNFSSWNPIYLLLLETLDCRHHLHPIHPIHSFCPPHLPLPFLLPMRFFLFFLEYQDSIHVWQFERFESSSSDLERPDCRHPLHSFLCIVAYSFTFFPFGALAGISNLHVWQFVPAWIRRLGGGECFVVVVFFVLYFSSCVCCLKAFSVGGR